MADALDSKSSPSNRVSVQVRSPVLLNTKGLTVIFRESFFCAQAQADTSLTQYWACMGSVWLVEIVHWRSN